jgi:hypothetical protein
MSNRVSLADLSAAISPNFRRASSEKQVKERCALAGPGLSDNVQMPAAIVLRNTKIPAEDRLADVTDIFEVEDHGPERAPKSSDPFAADGCVAHPTARTPSAIFKSAVL